MNILKKAFTTSRDGFMPSVFSQLDSKMSRPLSCRQELEDLICATTNWLPSLSRIERPWP